MKDLTIEAVDLTKIYKNPEPLIVKLTDNGTPVANRLIVIRINGVNYHRSTNGAGITSLNINLLPGSYPTNIRFSGDGTYNPATKSVIVRVIRNDTWQQLVKDSKHYFEVNKLPLKVLLKDGFATKMGHEIKETTLLMNNNTLNSPTFFFNSGNSGIEFEVSVVIREEYYYNNMSFRDYLDNWSKFATPVTVVTDAIDVPNGKYVMNIKSKKQNDKNKSIWKLRFKQFYENNLSFENVFSNKVSSLSAEDQTLLKYQVINEKSPKNVILILQKKLKEKGYWQWFKQERDANGIWHDILINNEYEMPREPNGVWDDQMQSDIFQFQFYAGFGNKKQGQCDRDTIIALVDTNYDKTRHYYPQDTWMWR